ncbi:MAG: hypothetical protein Q9225_005911, partial [Loekoesia sp. 1 TL-2023]
ETSTITHTNITIVINALNIPWPITDKPRLLTMQGIIPRRIRLMPILNPGLILRERDHELAGDGGISVEGVLHQVEPDALALLKEEQGEKMKMEVEQGEKMQMEEEVEGGQRQ